MVTFMGFILNFERKENEETCGNKINHVIEEL